MRRLRAESAVTFEGVAASLLSLSLLITPAFGAPSSSLGVVVYADRAHIGTGLASAGATIYGGDRLSTDPSGSVQVRAAAARLLLSSASVATFASDQANPAATLTSGSAVFSTANSKAFSLCVATAVIRPATDQPTIGQVTVIGPQEFIVKSTRGLLTIAVQDDIREIPEGAGYRVVLDATADPEPQGPRSTGGKPIGGPPTRAARNRFMWSAIAVTGVVTLLAVQEALESPARP